MTRLREKHGLAVLDTRCQLAWHSGAPGPTLSSHRPVSGLPFPDRRGRDEEKDRPGRVGPVQTKYNSPTPLLGTAMISYFSGEAPYFFSPLKHSGRTRTVRGRVTHVELARLF